MKLPRRNFCIWPRALRVVERAARSLGASLSNPTGPRRGTFRARWGDRHLRAACGSKADGPVGQAGLCREHRGRHRQYGTHQVAKAAPDGYTILFAFSSHVVNPDAVRAPALRPGQRLRAGHARSRVHHRAHRQPGRAGEDRQGARRAHQSQSRQIQLQLGGSGHPGSSRWRTVPPVAGPRPRSCSLWGRWACGRGGRRGHTPISFGSPQAAMQHVREGTVRALAVTSKKRSQIFPDVPTMTEAGYPQIEGDSWVGILVPAGTPADIIAVLHRESTKILAQPDMRERLAALGYDVRREHAGGVRQSHRDRDRPVG